jgi:release factor glutamine methyltransferase
MADEIWLIGMTMTPQNSAWTVDGLLRDGLRRLQGHGGADRHLDAEVLLAHVLQRPRAWILAHPDAPVDQAAAVAYHALIARRAHGEPVAYLTGRKSWYDLDLRVTPDVLVPRPETEGLLERAVAWARGRRVESVADVGTGSGALAIALCRALPAARVYASDLSERALAVARANAHIYDVADLITFLHGDLLAPLPTGLDLIVANLPYIGGEEYAGLQRDVRLFEPHMALVGGTGGHELLARLLAQAPGHLKRAGALMAELGPPQAAAALAAARQSFPKAQSRLEADLAGLMRYLIVET